ncbi:polycystic kidney disease protein 1-like 1 [Spea bombifrons]|uniref:polycystic kidney disease protein 1-like 1 n=1 Tax=Spea bombifrons TaxID=233779 RepID=UPI00234AD362|nr:polycystic kidney disease protein 1-like 1 [Spea bombifrons]
MILRILNFEPHYNSIQEGKGGSGGRLEGDFHDLQIALPNEDTVPNSEIGDNLVDSPNVLSSPSLTLMIDWPQLWISKNAFLNYTTSGISSQIVTFIPFVLKTDKMYMLDVSLVSHGNPVGRSQMYFKVNEMPQKVICQVQPRDGIEVYTIFSIFCTSGQEDLSYEFSYKTGKYSRQKILYQGRDVQYYFSLPAGKADDGFKGMNR